MLGNVNTNLNNRDKHPAFGFSKGIKDAAVNAMGGSAATYVFKLIENPVVDAAVVDVGTMILPRTYLDYKQNPDYGRETAFREITTAIIMMVQPGLLGEAAMLLTGNHGLYTNSDGLKTLHKAWEKAGGKDFKTKNEKEQVEVIQKYVKNVFARTRGQVGENQISLYEAFYNKLGNDKNKAHTEFNKFTKELADAYINGGSDKKTKLEEAAKTFLDTVKAESRLSVKINEKSYNTNIHDLIRDTEGAMNKVFKEGKDVEKLSKFLQKRSIIAVGASVATALSMQYINTLITKMKTGKTGFAGFKDFNDKQTEQTPQEKAKLWAKKLLATGIMGLSTLAIIGGFHGDKKFVGKNGWNNFVNSIELKGKASTLNIVKLIAGSIMCGRFLAIRENTEMNLSFIRDPFALFNWLVIGQLITKGLSSLGKNSIINGIIDKKRPILSWFSDLSVKSIDEIGKNNKAALAKHNAARAIGLGWQFAALGVGLTCFLNEKIINKSKQNSNAKSQTNVPATSLNEFIAKHNQKYNNYKGLTANA